MDIILRILALLLILTANAYAWNDEATHPTLSELSAEKFFGAEFISSFSKGIQIRKLIRDGSKFEDTGSLFQFLTGQARSLNHFHNPARATLGEAGLTDIPWFMSPGMSTPLWGQDGNYQNDKPQGNWSWQKVREHEYKYLIALSKADEDNSLADMLTGLGYQMHLIQDMGQPNHVRNDTHILDGASWIMGLETWVRKNDDLVRELLTPSNIPAVAVDLRPEFRDDAGNQKVPVARLFDTRGYKGARQPSADFNQGLAEYTNSNFFSESTVFAAEGFVGETPLKRYNPYPNKNETNIQDFIDHRLASFSVTDDGDVGPFETIVISKQNTTGEKLNCLATTGPFTNKLLLERGAEDKYFFRSFMYDACFPEYARKLIPASAAYSFAMLDYFFRGTMDVTIPPETPPTNKRIVLNAKNTTPNNESMNNGTIELMVAYSTYVKEAPAASSGKLVPTPIQRIRVPEKTGKRAINSTDTRLEFDLSAPELQLPLLAKDISLVLVYHGDLGNEKYSDPSGTDYGKAVAFEEIYLDGINGDLDLSLPTRGVYAATNDPALSATFGDFAIKARNTSASPSSGGDVELLVIYNKALASPFDSMDVPLEEEISYVSATLPGRSIATAAGSDFLYSLASARIPVDATNVYVYLLYHGSDGTELHGLKDISEPTPVDIFNDTDQSCVNGQWYNSGDEAATAADLLGNHNGIFDETILFPSTINTIYFKAGASDMITDTPTAADSTLTGSSLLPGQKLRLGYILTDYNFDYAIDEVVSSQGVYFPNQVFQGAGFEYQWDRGFDMMYGIRGETMYNGAGAVYENDVYPPGSPACPSH